MRLRTANKRAKRRPWKGGHLEWFRRVFGNDYDRLLYPYQRSALLSILDHEQQPARTLRWARSEPEPLWLGQDYYSKIHPAVMVVGKRVDRVIADDLMLADYSEIERRVAASFLGVSLEAEKASVHRLLYGQSPAVDEEAEDGEASDVG